MLERVAEFSLRREAEEKGVDLFKTLSVYNFGFWFDGRAAKLVLSLEPAVVAVVNVEGEATVYAAEQAGYCTLKANLMRLLGLHESLSGFFAAASHDPLLAPFARAWTGWRLRSASLWWALVTSVCQQNASFRQGWTMLAKLVKLYGRKALLEDGTAVLLPPTPFNVLTEPQKLREAGLGYRAETVSCIARAIAEGSLPSDEELAKAEYEEAENALVSIKGVGSYTARLALALSFRRYERPPIDRWVRAIAARAYGVDEKAVEREWEERWGLWSALAVISLTVALDAAPLKEALARVEAGRLLPEPGKLSPATLWSAGLV